MEDRETARIRKYEESKTTRIMMATVPHVTSGLGIRKFQADGFLLTRVYIHLTRIEKKSVEFVLSQRFFFVHIFHLANQFKRKGKFLPRTGHEGPGEE